MTGYELLDSGGQAKLERIGGHLVQRPTPAAIWRPQRGNKYWAKGASICQRTRDGGGKWEHASGDPGNLTAHWEGPVAACDFRLRFTGFGHCGMFPEQSPVWAWLQQQVADKQQELGDEPVRIANLFAYTGCGSLAMAAAGAEVFHVDSAKGILNWTKENIAANKNLKGSIRCLHEDARAFFRFSAKRGFKYHGLVMDPPAWGHGKAKETWTIEQDLMELLELAASCLHPGGFLHLSCYTPASKNPPSSPASAKSPNGPPSNTANFYWRTALQMMSANCQQGFMPAARGFNNQTPSDFVLILLFS